MFQLQRWLKKKPAEERGKQIFPWKAQNPLPGKPGFILVSAAEIAAKCQYKLLFESS